MTVVIYRPSQYPVSFIKNLQNLINWTTSKCNTVALVGGFRENIFKCSNVCTFMKGFAQLVSQSKTEKGTLIDHIYVKTEHCDVQTHVVPTYFSDHGG